MDPITREILKREEEAPKPSSKLSPDLTKKLSKVSANLEKVFTIPEFYQENENIKRKSAV
jgi:hypothetical protein